MKLIIEKPLIVAEEEEMFDDANTSEPFERPLKTLNKIFRVIWKSDMSKSIRKTSNFDENLRLQASQGLI